MPKQTISTQGGPLPPINGVITPLSSVITPVTHLFSASYRSYSWLGAHRSYRHAPLLIHQVSQIVLQCSLQAIYDSCRLQSHHTLNQILGHELVKEQPRNKKTKNKLVVWGICWGWNTTQLWGIKVVSNFFEFHPYLGKFPFWLIFSNELKPPSRL